MTDSGCWRGAPIQTFLARMVCTFPCPCEPLPSTCKELLAYYDSLKKKGLLVDLNPVPFRPSAPAIKRRAERFTRIVIERPHATFCLARDSIDRGPAFA